jgi:hypothetical protein
MKAFLARPAQCRELSIGLNGGDMSDGNDFRKWAAHVARQAADQPDADEARRLLSIAEYWVRLADTEECTHNQPVDAPL